MQVAKPAPAVSSDGAGGESMIVQRFGPEDFHGAIFD